MLMHMLTITDLYAYAQIHECYQAMYKERSSIGENALKAMEEELLVAIRKDLHIAAPELVDGIQADGILVPVGTEKDGIVISPSDEVFATDDPQLSVATRVKVVSPQEGALPQAPIYPGPTKKHTPQQETEQWVLSVLGRLRAILDPNVSEENDVADIPLADLVILSASIALGSLGLSLMCMLFLIYVVMIKSRK